MGDSRSTTPESFEKRAVVAEGWTPPEATPGSRSPACKKATGEADPAALAQDAATRLADAAEDLGR